MKKFLSLLMVLAMMMAVLAGCGGKSDKDEANGGASTEDPGAASDSGSAAAVDTNTVAVGAVVIVRDDVPEDDVYAFVSAIFENTAAISLITPISPPLSSSEYSVFSGSSVSASSVSGTVVSSFAVCSAHPGSKITNLSFQI